jgi:anti-sigma factor RsiW
MPEFPKMQCSKTRRWLSAYLDGELGERRKAHLEAHLARCGDCAAELARAKEEWVELADAEPASAVPGDLWSQVSRALDESQRLPWHRRRRLLVLRAACVSACVTLGFAGGALLSWRGGATDGAGSMSTVSERALVAEAFDAQAFGLGEEMERLLRCVPR